MTGRYRVSQNKLCVYNERTRHPVRVCLTDVFLDNNGGLLMLKKKDFLLVPVQDVCSKFNRVYSYCNGNVKQFLLT